MATLGRRLNADDGQECPSYIVLETMNYYLVLLIATLAFVPRTLAAADDAVWKGMFPSRGTKSDLPVEIFIPTKEARGTIPMVVYLKGLNIPRLGTDGDQAIVTNLLKRGMAVAIVDYQSKAFASNLHLLADVCNLREAFGAHRDAYLAFVKEKPFAMDPDELGLNYETLKVSEGKSMTRLVLKHPSRNLSQTISASDIYVIPAGYTVHRRIPVVKNGQVPVGDMRTYFFDLIAPSNPGEPVPTILEPCTTIIRRGEPATSLNVNSSFFMSYACHGYAYCALSYIYQYDSEGNRTWGLHGPEHKAIRLLRARKDEWGLSGKVGIAGISKAAACSLFTAARRYGQEPRQIDEATMNRAPYNYLYGSAPHHEVLKPIYERLGMQETYKRHTADRTLSVPLENTRDTSVPEATPGPHADQSDRPDCCLAVSSGFDHHCMASVIPYLNKGMPPLYLGYGLEEARRQLLADNHHSAPFCLRSICRVLDDIGYRDYTLYEQPELGHEYNFHQYDQIVEFFDRNLK